MFLPNERIVDMHEALNDLGRCLQQFLEDVLPASGPDWWENVALAQLTFQQQRTIDEIRDYCGRNGIAISEQDELSDDDQKPTEGGEKARA
jgi:hypothetical protein